MEQPRLSDSVIESTVEWYIITTSEYFGVLSIRLLWIWKLPPGNALALFLIYWQVCIPGLVLKGQSHNFAVYVVSLPFYEYIDFVLEMFISPRPRSKVVVRTGASTYSSVTASRTVVVGERRERERVSVTPTALSQRCHYDATTTFTIMKTSPRRYQVCWRI